MANAKDEVLMLERKFWSEAATPEFYDETLTDDAIAVMEPMGFIEKSAAREMAKQGDHFSDLKMHDVHVMELTPDTVALAYHGEGKRAKSGEPYRGSINSVYVKRKGRWQLAMTSHQPWKEGK